MTYHEPPKTFVTHRGKLEVKSPKHYDASQKSQSNIVVQPLVVVDGQELKTVQKAIVARNPIDEMKNIRNRYQGEYAIIRETMQNSERAGRDHKLPVDIKITITPITYKIEDTAGGVDKYSIDKVFNLGQSGWQNLGEGTNPFGQGFLSFILLFNKVEVISNDVNAEFDWERIESEYDKNKNFDLSKAYFAQESPSPETFGAKGKFIAIFSKPLPSYNYEKAIEQAKIYAKTLPVNSVLINNELANNKIDFSHAPHGFTEVKKSYRDIMGIEGYFAPGTENDAIRLYFQGLPVGAATNAGVDNYFYKLPSILGDVNINTTFYGRPSENRDSWIMDSNIEKTISTIRDLAKQRAIDMIKFSSQSGIEQFQHFISSYTTFDDIMYFIRFEVIAPEVMNLVSKSERSLHPELDDKAFDEHMKSIMSSQSKLNESIERAKYYTDKVDTKSYNEREQEILKEKQKLAEQKLEDTKSKEQVLQEETQQIKKEKTEEQQKTHTAKQNIKEFLDTRDSGGLTAAKWNKETFWVERDMAMVYMNEINTAMYHRIPLSFAENKYQKQLFNNRKNFHHLRELQQLMSNASKLSSAGARNDKERRIEYIMKVFIDAAGFPQIKIVIANIDFKTVIHVPYSNVKIEEPKEVAAYAEGDTIYFQRKLSFGGSEGGEIDGYYGIESLYPYFIYNNFDIDNKSIGQGDIAVFSKIRKLLSHEMAHSLYHTTDNTDTHYKAMLEIDAKFDKVISEFKASSVTTTTPDLKPKTKERIGISEGDNVVVTYTKGSNDNLEKQQYSAAKPSKFHKKDIFYYEEKKGYYTYEELLLKFETQEQMLQFSKPIGYKVGDYVVIKETESNAYETKATTMNGRLTEFTINHLLKVKFEDGFSNIITHEDIISKAEPHRKYSDTEKSEKGNKMLVMYGRIKSFLSSHPNSTKQEIISGISELQSYSEPTSYIWNTINKYGKNEIEHSTTRPQRFRVR